MTEDIDLEELVHLEQTFFDAGYKDGFAHGRMHGLIEGRALGGEKGFDIWEELGFYEGFASMWEAVCVQRGRHDQDQRALHHIKHLLDLVRQFPTVNPSATTARSNDDSIDTDTELDIAKLQRQIRSRYKVLCASLGVRPTLRALPGSSGNEEDDDHDKKSRSKSSLWTTIAGDGEVKRATVQGLSF